MMTRRFLVAAFLFALVALPACSSHSAAVDDGWEWGQSRGARMEALDLDGQSARGTVDLGRVNHAYRSYVRVDQLDDAGAVVASQRGRLVMDTSHAIPRRSHRGRFDVGLKPGAGEKLRISIER